MVTKVLVVDDHNLFREGLASLLAKQDDFHVVGEAGSVRDAIEKSRLLNPDLILMDISLPDGTGLEATKAILDFKPEVKIVMLTIHEADDLLFIALRNGAIGYLLKNIPAKELLKSLRALERGEVALSRTLTGRIVKEFRRVGNAQVYSDQSLSDLTKREIEVLKFLGLGSTNGEIAQNLYISENTVKVHVHNILKKLKLRNRSEAYLLAQRMRFSFPLES